MNKEQNVVNFYVTCNKLKNVIRTGWNNWKVKRDRIESVAEHIYGAQMLAIAMIHEYEYDVNLMKVVYMLAIHELGETIIGDLTPFQITKEEKEKIEHEAVHKILDSLIGGETIEELFLEFYERKTKEALFAYQCDKFECDLQCKLYDEEGCVDYTKQEGNNSAKDELVVGLLEKEKSWSGMWLEFDKKKYPYDENFIAVSNYVKNNKIGDIDDQLQ
jgi:putative hydrolase of HD superfamily